MTTRTSNLRTLVADRLLYVSDLLATKTEEKCKEFRRDFGGVPLLNWLPFKVKAWPLNLSVPGVSYWVTPRGRLGIVYNGRRQNRIQLVRRNAITHFIAHKLIGAANKLIDEIQTNS